VKKLILLFLINIIVFNIQLLGQNGFLMHSKLKNKVRKISYGNKVIIEIKENSIIPSNCSSFSSTQNGVYEMRITSYNNQILTFNDSIQIPYNSINRIYVKTPGRAIKIWVTFILMGGQSVLFVQNLYRGLVYTFMLIPINVILLKNSNRPNFNCKDWYPLEIPIKP